MQAHLLPGGPQQHSPGQVSNCQIVEEGKDSSSLAVHEADVAGMPACGTPPRPWHGVTMVAVPTERQVTCLRCLNR